MSFLATPVSYKWKSIVLVIYQEFGFSGAEFFTDSVCFPSPILWEMKLKAVQRKLVTKAKRLGIVSEDDVFKVIS